MLRSDGPPSSFPSLVTGQEDLSPEELVVWKDELRVLSSERFLDFRYATITPSFCKLHSEAKRVWLRGL